MSSEENKKIVHRLFTEVFNNKNLTVIDELVDDNYVNHAFKGVPPGPTGFRMVVEMFNTAFPDAHMYIDDQIAEGEKVVGRGRFTGTQSGEFQGIAPTGRAIDMSYIDIFRVENGKLVENWVAMDQLGMLQQLGVIPATENA